ncbi:MAG: peptidoglycan-binding protein [Parasporobacterium sp.]|nr:peptidoglycan-binding protein [Parasporobacterium sp.]
MIKNIKPVMIITAAAAMSVTLSGCGMLGRTASETEPETQAYTVSYLDLIGSVDVNSGSLDMMELLTTTTTELEATTTEPETTTEEPTTTTEPETTTEEPTTTTEPETTTTQPETTTEEPTTAPPATIRLKIELPLKYNDYSYSVAALQNRLIQLGYLSDEQADGRFGPITQNAVRAFQTANGIEPTGEVEDITYAALCSVNAVTAWDISVAAAIVGDVKIADASAGHVHTSASPDSIIQYYGSQVVPPTCTTEGYTLHTCAVCGESYKDAIIPPKGHIFQAVISGGKITRTCTVCGYFYTEGE